MKTFEQCCDEIAKKRGYRMMQQIMIIEVPAFKDVWDYIIEKYPNIKFVYYKTYTHTGGTTVYLTLEQSNLNFNP